MHGYVSGRRCPKDRLHKAKEGGRLGKNRHNIYLTNTSNCGIILVVKKEGEGKPPSYTPANPVRNQQRQTPRWSVLSITPTNADCQDRQENPNV